MNENYLIFDSHSFSLFLSPSLFLCQIYVWKRSNPKAPAYLYFADNDPSKGDEPRRPVLSLRISSFNKSDLVVILGGTLVRR